MDALKCETCNGFLKIVDGDDIIVCEYCGTQHTRSKLVNSVTPDMDSLFKRGLLFLEDCNGKKASEYFEKALDINPEYAPAYIGKLCVELRINKEMNLAKYNTPLDNIPNYKKALRFADTKYHTILTGYNDAIKERIRQEKEEELCRIAKRNRALEEQRLERNRIAEEQKRVIEAKRKRARKIIAIALASTITGIAAFGIVVNMLIMPVLEYNRAEKLLADGKYMEAYNAFFELRKFDEAHEAQKMVSVVAVGWNRHDQCIVWHWNDIIAIGASTYRTVGVRSDGTVMIAGEESSDINTDKWSDIISVSVGWVHVVGLKSDGTVVATGNNATGRCDVENWNDIIAVSTHGWHTVGLKSDGTVVAVGANSRGQCNISAWSDIVAIAAGDSHTVGIK
jgi:tetratricopeptide (TPR) repeat protein